MPPYQRHLDGKMAEQIACNYLQKQGLILLEKNYRCFLGEVDLIMKDNQHIVFIEVRSRKRTEYGSALESVTKPKQMRIIRTATHFLQTKKWLFKINSRFDIVQVHLTCNTKPLEWIKNAFWVE